MLTPDTPSPSEWDHFLDHQVDAHLLQTAAWGDVKAAFGWQVARVGLRDEWGDLVAGAQLLLKPLPLRAGTMAYLPMGPYAADHQHWDALWAAIDEVAKDQRAAFLKWEPGILTTGMTPDFAALGFRESPQTIQPPRTILIDISDEDEDSLLARMNQGTRRKIRQSQKQGVRYFQATRDDLPRFNALMQATGERDGFGVHEAEYYTMIFERFVPRDAALILAEHEGELIAAVFVFAKMFQAWYLYGASSDEKRNLMASYGVQWEAVRWARARGCHTYDLWGVPDADRETLEAEFQERRDGLWGVYGFKRGWGGDVVRSAGAWDRVYNPLLYGMYALTLRLRP